MDKVQVMRASIDGRWVALLDTVVGTYGFANRYSTSTIGYYLSERKGGAFQRSFTLPNDVDAEKIDTQFAKGVLKITVKSVEAEAKTRKIEVKAARECYTEEGWLKPAL
ncbi:MAG: Hsp20 family protein [Gammaproteobacteria bacterium]